MNLLESLSLHEHMLADSIRLNAYHAAIDRYVTSQDCVVDIGTGTGVLAFFAAAKKPRQGLRARSFRARCWTMPGAAAANGISNLSFVASSSRKFQPRKRLM